MKKRTFAMMISGIVLAVVAIVIAVVLVVVMPSGSKNGNVSISTNDNTMNVSGSDGVIDIDGASDDDGTGSMNASIGGDTSDDGDASNAGDTENEENGNVASNDNDDDADANASNNRGNGGSSMSVTDITATDKKTVTDALSSVTKITGSTSSYDVNGLKETAGDYFANVDDIPSGYRTFTNYVYRIMSNLDTPENIAFNGEHRTFISSGDMTAATVGVDGSVYTVDVTYDITYTPLSDDEEVRTERKTINETIRINSNGKIYAIEDNI